MAKDGPGDMAPRAQIPTMVSQAVRFIYFSLAKSASVVQHGPLGKGGHRSMQPIFLAGAQSWQLAWPGHNIFIEGQAVIVFFVGYIEALGMVKTLCRVVIDKTTEFESVMTIFGVVDQSAPDPLVLVTYLNEQTVDVILTEGNKAQYLAVLLVDKGFV